ncbi:VOC family protein, partial [Burkholderia multivorans]|uniref:VOC family protein n=1 Tax=Burkholderia multivorans TaxID=87883 RepID=UPI000DB82658
MDPVIPAHLDHLVVTVPDLAAGVDDFARATGVRPVPGVRAANFLVGLAPAGLQAGARTYLEILGPDPGQERPADGTLPLDAHLATAPTLQTWAIHPPEFPDRVAAANS